MMGGMYELLITHDRNSKMSPLAQKALSSPAVLACAQFRSVLLIHSNRQLLGMKTTKTSTTIGFACVQVYNFECILITICVAYRVHPTPRKEFPMDLVRVMLLHAVIIRMV